MSVNPDDAARVIRSGRGDVRRECATADEVVRMVTMARRPAGEVDGAGRHGNCRD